MIAGVIRDEMSRQHVDYYQRLRYFPIGVTDGSSSSHSSSASGDGVTPRSS